MLLYRGCRPIRVDSFGGLNTLQDRMDLPVGVSPSCQNVEFAPGLVRSRGGLSAFFGENANVLTNGISLYIARNRDRHILIYQDGKLWSSTTAGAGTLVDSDMDASRETRMLAATMYGRSYVTLRSGFDTYGVGTPRTYDGTHVDRFTYGSPGKPPTCAANTNVGTIAAATRYAVVCFVMRSGFVTPPSALSAPFTTVVNKKMDWTVAPIGPPACSAKMLFVTTAAAVSPFSAQDFYHIPGVMRLDDNTTTHLDDIDFTEAQLVAGIPLTDFMDVLSPGPLVGVIPYKDRTVSWGQPSTVGAQDNVALYQSSGAPEFFAARNLRFDGGGLAGTVPNAWAVVGGATGGAFATHAGEPNPVWEITSDGITTGQGKLRNGISVGSSVLEAALQAGVEYGVRVRLAASSPLASGTAKITLSSPYGGGWSYNLTVNATDLSENWRTFTGTLGVVQYGLSGYGGINLDIEMDAPTPVGTSIAFGSIDFYRTSEPQDVGSSTLLVSNAFDPERINATTGFIVVNDGDGEDVQTAVVIRNTLYIFKNHSIYAAADDGVSEPSGWPVQLVSDTVGTASPRGVSVGDGWCVTADRAGLFLFTGGVPQKLSDEIQPTWDSINWAYASTITVTVDPEAQRIYVGLPFGDDTQPSVTYVLDYHEGWAEDKRKWTVWTIGANESALVELDGDRKATLFGMNDETGNVLEFDSDATEDNGAIIEAFYETAPLGLPDGNTMFAGMAAWMKGEGTMLVSYRLPDDTLDLLWPTPLQPSAAVQTERLMRLDGARIGFRFLTGSEGSYFTLDRLMFMAKASPWRQFVGFGP